MRITKDSPLNKIPVNLEPKHILLFDSLRYSINMCFTSWDLLIAKLERLSSSNFEEYETEKYIVFMHAWSVVDNLDRLRSLFGVLDKEHLDKVFGEPELLRGLRNSFHHMYDRLESGVDLSYPILGTLSWVFHEKSHGKTLYCNNFVSGFQYGEREFPMINPIGKKIDMPIGLVTLHGIANLRGGNPSVCSLEISEMMHRLNSAVDNLEKSWKEQVESGVFKQDFLMREIAMSIVFQMGDFIHSGGAE